MKSATTLWPGPIPIRAAFGTVTYASQWSSHSINRGTSHRTDLERLTIRLDDGTEIDTQSVGHEGIERGNRVIVYFEPISNKVVGIHDCARKATSVHYIGWWQVLVADWMHYAILGIAVIGALTGLYVWAMNTPFSLGAVAIAVPIGLAAGALIYFALLLGWSLIALTIVVPPLFVISSILFRVHAAVAKDPGPALAKQRLDDLAKAHWERAARSTDPAELPALSNTSAIPADAVLVTNHNGDPMYYQDDAGRRYAPLSQR